MPGACRNSGVRRVAKELAVASQIIRLALLQNRVIEAVPEPCEELRLVDLQVLRERFGDPEDRRQRLVPAEVLGDVAELSHEVRGVQLLVVLVSLGGERRRETGLPVGIDDAAIRGREAERQPRRIEAGEVLGGPSIIVHRVCQQPAEEDLPLQEGRTQPDRFQCRPCVVVFPSFVQSEGQ